MFTASLARNYQIAAITALVLLVPSVGFMLLIERFLRAETLAKSADRSWSAADRSERHRR
jgi:putative spermidine/putrescine transport system permease protein